MLYLAGVGECPPVQLHGKGFQSPADVSDTRIHGGGSMHSHELFTLFSLGRRTRDGVRGDGAKKI